MDPITEITFVWAGILPILAVQANQNSNLMGQD
jgi:hypothetical protein